MSRNLPGELYFKAREACIKTEWLPILTRLDATLRTFRSGQLSAASVRRVLAELSQAAGVLEALGRRPDDFLEALRGIGAALEPGGLENAQLHFEDVCLQAVGDIALAPGPTGWKHANLLHHAGQLLEKGWLPNETLRIVAETFLDSLLYQAYLIRGIELRRLFRDLQRTAHEYLAMTRTPACCPSGLLGLIDQVEEQTREEKVLCVRCGRSGEIGFVICLCGARMIGRPASVWSLDMRRDTPRARVQRLLEAAEQAADGRIPVHRLEPLIVGLEKGMQQFARELPATPALPRQGLGQAELARVERVEAVFEESLEQMDWAAAEALRGLGKMRRFLRDRDVLQLTLGGIAVCTASAMIDEAQEAMDAALAA